MIFGSTRDVRMILHIGREFVQDMVEQEVLYYKINLEGTEVNLYGESDSKEYWGPVRLTCLIKRGDQEWGELESVPDMNRTFSFAFYKEDLRDAECLPEVGDIIEWHKDYFEVDNIKENQMFLGKDQEYRIQDREPDRTGNFGHSVSVVCGCHLSRISHLNIIRQNR